MSFALDPQVGAALAHHLDSVAPDADAAKRASADRIRVLETL